MVLPVECAHFILKYTQKLVIIDWTNIEFLLSGGTRDAAVNKKYGFYFFINALLQVYEVVNLFFLQSLLLTLEKQHLLPTPSMVVCMYMYNSKLFIHVTFVFKFTKRKFSMTHTFHFYVKTIKCHLNQNYSLSSNIMLILPHSPLLCLVLWLPLPATNWQSGGWKIIPREGVLSAENHRKGEQHENHLGS